MKRFRFLFFDILLLILPHKIK